MTEISATGLGGRVVFDGKFVTIYREGFFARSTIGKGEKRIPLKSIAAIQWKAPTALNNGYIEFSIPGGNETRSRVGQQYLDAAKNENAVVLRKKDGPAFEELRAAIENAIAELQFRGTCRVRGAPAQVHRPRPGRRSWR